MRQIVRITSPASTPVQLDLTDKFKAAAAGVDDVHSLRWLSINSDDVHLNGNFLRKTAAKG